MTAKVVLKPRHRVSPGCSWAGAPELISSFFPLDASIRYVPLVEPRSCAYQALFSVKMRRCLAEASGPTSVTAPSSSASAPMTEPVADGATT